MTPASDIALVEAATARLVAAVEALPDERLSEPSALPGWSRAHVLTHLARNADGMRNMLLSARSGEVVFMYPSTAMRNADIDAGASRAPALVRLDACVASERFLVEARAMPEAAWSAQVRMGAGDAPVVLLEAASLVLFRLREIEVHHLDLDAGYSLAETTPAAARRLLEDATTRMRAHGGLACTLTSTTDATSWRLAAGDAPSPTVTGTDADLVGWLLRRTDGHGLTVHGAATLPDVPSLG